MAENINFISANELPVAEGDEVSVLCLENGELKQKAASGLGGTVYDIVVRITGAWDADNGEITVTGEILSGSYDAVLEKLDAGIMPVALITERGTFDGGMERKLAWECRPGWISIPNAIEGLVLEDNGGPYLLQPDGTVLIG